MHCGKIPEDESVKHGNKRAFDKAKASNSAPSGLECKAMSRETSKATFNTWKATESLWTILNAIPDDKIEKFEWDFILKSLGKEEQILSQDDSDFLFFYLDKDNSGDISKPELRSLLNKVVRVNKWGDKNTPSRREMLLRTRDYALEDRKENFAIDYTIQKEIITVKNGLNRLLEQIRNANKYYNELSIHNKKTVFPDPQEIYDDHLKEHEKVISKYANVSLQTRYNEVMRLLKVAKVEYTNVISQTQVYLEQGEELERLRDRDERCCKIFWCLLPC